MRFLRGSAAPVRAVLTAGNLIGAAPPSLSPEQRALYQAHTRRSLASVLEQATADDADLVLIAGGLFARSDPALEDVRFASQCLRRVREAGIVVIALDEADEPATDGTGIAFLEELGLLASVRPQGRVRSRTVEVAGLVLDVGADPTFSHAEIGSHGSPLRIALTTESHALQRREATTAADIIVVGDLPNPGQRRLGDGLVICPGWSAPSATERRAESGFAMVDLDHDGVISAEFRELPSAAQVVVSFRAGDLLDGDPAAAIRERLAPLIGDTPLVTLEFVGEFSREFWHRCRVGDLSRRASAAGTLVHVDLKQLDVPSGPADARPTRSFVVEVRRAADKMSDGAVPGENAGAVARARRSVIDGFRRRAVSPAA